MRIPSRLITGYMKWMSGLFRFWCCLHDGHTPQESPFTWFWQWMYCARARASRNLPIPEMPESIIAWGILPASTMLLNALIVSLCPAISENFMILN